MFRIAWQFIRYDKAKSLGVTLGIVISTFLIGQQTGIYLFLTQLMSTIVDNTHSDIWVVDSKTTNANALGSLDISKVQEIKSLPGVAKVYPVAVAVGNATFPDGSSAGVQIIGSDAPWFRAGPPKQKIIAGRLSDLLEDGAVSSDAFDSKTLGNIQRGSHFEINGKSAFEAVQTRGVRGFGFTYLFSTLDRARYFGGMPSTKVSAILVDVDPGMDPQQVCDSINRSIFGVKAWRSRDFSRATVAFILGTSGIGISTFTLIIFAVVAGFFIIGLTMYSAALDRLRDYGTLKAIGATNRYIIQLILVQAGSFASIGFLLGMLFLQGFRRGLAAQGVLFQLTPGLLASFLGITMLISLGGAAFAITRITRLEPASVFRS